MGRDVNLEGFPRVIRVSGVARVLKVAWMVVARMPEVELIPVPSLWWPATATFGKRGHYFRVAVTFATPRLYSYSQSFQTNRKHNTVKNSLYVY